jgi:hypothetical protein
MVTPEAVHAVEEEGFPTEEHEVVGASVRHGRQPKTSVVKNATAAVHVHNTG